MARLLDFLPLIILTGFAAVLAWVGYQTYLYTQTLAQRGKQEMAKRNITIHKDGAKVGVTGMGNEEYSGKTQEWLVGAWNLSSWPQYRSRFWNKGVGEKGMGGKGKGGGGAGVGR